MSELIISDNLFLGTQELNRFKKFIEQDSIRQQLLLHTKTFGIVKGFYNLDGQYVEPRSSLSVINRGKDIFLTPGLAINSKGEVITLKQDLKLNIPNTGLKYYVFISYEFTHIESGTVSVTEDGSIVGTDTEFLNILRGRPDFPVKIKFTNSTNGNVFEYEVLSVVDNYNAKIFGDFNAEDNLKYQVVGTFTPGFFPSLDNKYIYKYDSVKIRISSDKDTLDKDNEFLIAEVVSSTDITIKDLRSKFWTTRASFDFEYFTHNPMNPILGVDWVKWDLQTTPRDRNEVNISWGYDVSNYTINATSNQINLISGFGGLLKEDNIDAFSNGYFNGWLIYCPVTGYISEIISSIKSSSQIVINLDVLDVDSIKGSLHIIPNLEEIQIEVTYPKSAGVNSVSHETFTFPVYQCSGKCYIRIVDTDNPTLYTLRYRYRNHKLATKWFNFNSDSIGYYTETSFTEKGEFKPLLSDRIKQQVVVDNNAGFLKLVPSHRTLQNILNTIDIGDLIGVEHNYVSVSDSLIELTVGGNKQNQIFHFNDLILTQSLFIHLKDTNASNNKCKNGNKFTIQLTGRLTVPKEFNFFIVENYINSAQNTTLLEIDQKVANFINKNSRFNGFNVTFTYDGVRWTMLAPNEIEIFNTVNNISKQAYIIGEIKQGFFDVNNLPPGWFLCDGRNGTPDLRNMFLRGASNERKYGSFQDFAQQNIIGEIHGFSPKGSRGAPWGVFKSNDQWSTGIRGGGKSDDWGFRIRIDASDQIKTDKEVRPANIAVVYIMYLGEK